MRPQKIARALPPIADKGDGWDLNPWLLGVRNGVIDLRTGELRAGRSEDRITKSTPWDYDPEADCPRFSRFIREVCDGDDEMANWLHRALGYSIQGTLKEQCYFTLIGTTQNGKSTLLNVLRHVLGNTYAGHADWSTFSAGGEHQHSTSLMDLDGPRFVTASETAQVTALNEARMKAVTGGDAVTEHKMRQNNWTFQPQCKVWLATNYLPRITDHSEAMWRRIKAIPFDRQFDPATEPDLDETLQREAPGIQTWLVDGCLKWQKDHLGLRVPERVANRGEEYKEGSIAEANPLSEFLDGRCVLAPKYETPTGALYKDYQKWCYADGVPVRERLTHTAFSTGLTNSGFEHRRTKHGRIWTGIGLASQWAPLPTKAEVEFKEVMGQVDD